MPKAIKLPSPEFFIALAQYTVDTVAGRVYNRHGREVFTSCTDGYHTMLIYYGNPRQTKPTKRAHVIWWAHYHRWPTQMLDHEDRCRSNDAIKNLRVSTPTLNAHNCTRSDRDLPPGVHFNSRMKSKPYFSMHKNKHIGFFATIKEAQTAYQQRTGEL